MKSVIIHTLTLLFVLMTSTVTAWTQTEAEELVQMHKDAGDHFDREDWVSGKPIPRPYIYFGPSFMGGGYAMFAYTLEAGMNIEATHFITRADASYDNGHKVDDGTGPNPKGRDRYLDGAFYFRPALPGWKRGLYFGGGYKWNELSTTNYHKESGRYMVGGGYDWFLRVCESCRRDLSMRLNVDWVTAGNDWENGSHGPDITVTMPSPREHRHWFLRQEIGIYMFHTTVTETDNAFLTRQQRAEKSYDSFAEVGMQYRFW
jgi:hypothetical protein